MGRIVIQLLMAFLGALGFALVFGMRKRYLFLASLGGLLAWAVYLTVEALLSVEFLSGLMAAAFAVLYAELMARRLKTPATLLVIPAIIPLVPGGSLYYTMACVVRRDFAGARSYGLQTAEFALAIAAGLSLVIALRDLRARK